MAVRKTRKDNEVNVEVEEKAEDIAEETNTVPTVEIPEMPKVEVSKETVAEVKSVNIPTAKEEEKNVKIRMRADHKCCIAKVRYDLKKGQVYTVPANVRSILNNAGFLAPL